MLPTRIEVTPSDRIVEQLRSQIPVTTTMTMTCLPHLGLERTIQASIELSHLATHIVTQMCFVAPKIRNFVALLRREGVELPGWASVAGFMQRANHAQLAARIGVGRSPEAA